MADGTEESLATRVDGGGDAPSTGGEPRGASDELPSRVGRFYVLRKLGEGGMGTVLLAYDEKLERRLALKLWRPRIDRDERGRVEREAQALARLSHPNVVQVYEVGEHRGTIYTAMEYVEGETLRRWVRGARRSPLEIVERYLQAGRGLAAAHRAGLVHRDFKPDNAVVGADGRVRVLDFGLARATGVELEPPRLPDAEGEGEVVGLSASITRIGTVLGTPAYMPPEQLEGVLADAQSDQFSFCVALWEALYGARPYVGDSLKELAAAIRRGAPNEPPGRRAPKWVRAALLRGLSAMPAGRFPTMSGLLAALERDPRAARRRTLAAGLGAALLAGAAIAVWVDHGRTTARCEERAALVDAVWTPAVKAEARAAVLGTQAPFAADAWRRVESALDAWALEFRAAMSPTCLAGQEGDPLAGARQACLIDQLDALRGWTEVLRTADRGVVARAAMAASELPRLRACDDPPAPARRGSGFDHLAGLAERRRLTQARALLELGRVSEGAALAGAALGAGQALGDPALRAEAELLLGRAARRSGRFAAAEQWYVRAYYLAGEAGADAVAAESASDLVQVVGYALARHDEGEAWARQARLFARRLGGVRGATIESAVDNNSGAVLASRGDPAGAERLFRRVLAFREAELGVGHPGLAGVYNNIGAAARARGDLATAEEALRTALSLREQLLGPDHPEVAASLNNLAVLLYDQARHETSLELGRRALAIRERAVGPEHADVGVSLNNLGNSLEGLGRFEEAAVSLRRAFAVWEKALGPMHPNVAMALANLSRVQLRRGLWSEARTSAERALAIYAAASGADPGHHAQAFERHSAALAGEGRVAEALAVDARAQELRRRRGVREDADLAMGLATLGTLLAERGRPDEAVPRLRRALAIRERLRGPEHVEVAFTRVQLAEALRLAGDRAGADELLRAACDVVVQTWPEEHAHVAHARLICGEAELAAGRAGAAARLLSAAQGGGEAGLSRERAGRLHLALARALRDTGAPAAESAALVEQARADFTAAGPAAGSRLAEAAAWPLPSGGR